MASALRWRRLARRVAGFTALVSLVFAAACGGDTTGRNDAGGGLTTVRVNSVGGAADVPLYIAKEKGFFAEEGLQVEFVPVKNTSDLPALLSGGEIDFAIGQPNAAFFNAAATGLKDPVVLATNTYDVRTRIPGLLVRKELADSGEVKTAADLKGRKIAVIGPSTSSQYFAEKVLQGAGLTASDVKFTVLGLPDMVTALSSGAIDAAWMFEPLASKAVKDGVGVRMASVGEVAPGFPSWVQAREKIMGDRKTVQAFVNALMKAIADYDGLLKADDRDAIVAVLVKYTQQKDASDWDGVELPTVNVEGGFDQSLVDAFQAYLIDRGVVKTRTDVAKLSDFSFRDAYLAAASSAAAPR